MGANTSRLRIGVWNPHSETIDNADFVLSHIARTEQATLDQLQPIFNQIIDSFIRGTFDPRSYGSSPAQTNNDSLDDMS